MAVRKVVKLKTPMEMWGYRYPAGTRMTVVRQYGSSYELMTPHRQVGTLLIEHTEPIGAKTAPPPRGLRYGVSESKAREMDSAYNSALAVLDRSPTAESAPSRPSGGALTLVEKENRRVNDGSSRGRVVAFLRSRGGKASYGEVTDRLGKDSISAVKSLIRKGWIVQKS
jgi:hypothetical protein